jgi:hypothetical protein
VAKVKNTFTFRVCTHRKSLVLASDHQIGYFPVLNILVQVSPYNSTALENTAYSAFSTTKLLLFLGLSSVVEKPILIPGWVFLAKSEN